MEKSYLISKHDFDQLVQIIEDLYEQLESKIHRYLSTRPEDKESSKKRDIWRKM